MKKVFGIMAATLLSVTVFAQKGFYLGYENGIKWDKFHYINEKENELNHFGFDGVIGVVVGYKIKGYTIETGVQNYYTSKPGIIYDYNTGEAHKSVFSTGSSGMNSCIIPLRFGKEYMMCNNKLFVKPEVAFTTIISQGLSVDGSIGEWGTGIHFPGDEGFSVPSADSTKGSTYRKSNIDFGIETNLSFGVRIKERADLFVKGSYHSSFNPLFYDTIIHYSENEPVNATQTFTGNSFLFQIGTRFYFGKRSV